MNIASPTLIHNPYPGLRSYDTSDHQNFFGRDRQISELLRQLVRRNFVVVVGASGTGKSSLVRAGLIPQLQSGHRTRHGEQWDVVVSSPGSSPLQNLAQELSAHFAPNDAMAEKFTQASLLNGGHALLDYCQRNSTQNVLIVIDQFEEIFHRQSRTSATIDETRIFVDLLENVSSARNCNVHILITMRMDFLADCARYSGLTEAVSDGIFMVPRLDRDQRREVIVKPAEAAGAHLSPH